MSALLVARGAPRGSRGNARPRWLMLVELRMRKRLPHRSFLEWRIHPPHGNTASGTSTARAAIDGSHNSTSPKSSIMSTTNAPFHSPLPAQPGMSRFSEMQWRELLDEDRFALSTISLLLASIVGVGLAGMAVVVAILAFGG